MSGSIDIQSVAKTFPATASPPVRNKAKRRYTPLFSMRFTVEERKRLDEMAGNQPLGSYIRDWLLGEQAEKRRRVKKPTADNAMLALVLSEFGQSRLVSNINQLVKVVNMGTLDMTPETEQEIEQACRESKPWKRCSTQRLA